MTTLLPISDPPRTAGAWSAQRPEPARFWVRYRPRAWPGADVPWSDLGTAVLRDGRVAVEGEKAAELPEGLDPAPAGLAADTVYLPPAPRALEGERRELAARLAARGTPVLLQIPVAGGGDGALPARGEIEGVLTVYDPLPRILSAGWRPALDALAALRPVPGSALVWPLLAGLSDDAPRAVAARLSEADLAGRFAAVQPLALDLTPTQRRALAEGREPAVYDALFHGPAPAERPLTRALGDRGPLPFLPRPLPAEAPRPHPTVDNRRIAGVLALAAELWLRVGRAPVAGQALFQAARWADETDRDLAALAREGNLDVLPALDARARRLTAEAAGMAGDPSADPDPGETTAGSAAGRYPSLIRELLAEYRGGAAAGAGAEIVTGEEEE